MMIDTSPWSCCSRWSPWLACSGHTISSTGPSVSPFRDFFRESSPWEHSPKEYSPKQGPAHIVSHAPRVLNLVIIWILGYFWDAHMQLGSIPTSCHPKPQLSTMFGLCSDKKKLDFNNNGFARKESIKPTSVTDL